MEIPTLSAEAAAAGVAAEPSSSPLMPPDAAAATRFSSLMQGAGQPSALDASQAVAATPISTPPATTGATSLTELLRERAAALSNRWRDTMSQVAKVGDGSSYSALLKTQFEVGKINLEHAVMTQGISRSTQNVDSMVKMQ